MSKDFPEYQRQSGISPPQLSRGEIGAFGNAMAEVGQTSEMIGQFGMAIATNAAVEQATIEGVKASETPGRTLIPAFTEAGKAFNQAYKVGEYQNVLTSGESYINKAYFLASKKPNTKTLELFEKNSLKTIEDKINLVSAENRPKIKRQLMDAYESRYFKLAHAAEAENERVQHANFKSNLANSYEQIQEFYAMGFGEKAQEKLKATEEYIREQREVGLIKSDELMQDALKDIRLTAEKAKLQGQMAAAIKSGKGAEFLASRANVPATPDNMIINAALQHQFSEYNHLKGTQSHISKIEALSKASTGQLSDQDRREARMKMTELDRADFDSHLAKATLKNIKDNQASQFIRANASNEVALANADSTSLNKVYEEDINNFQKLQGRAPNMEEIAGIVSQYNVPIPSFNKQLSAMINSIDPNTAIQGSALYRGLLNNPRTVDGLDAATVTRATSINDGIHAGQPPVQIFNKLDLNAKDLTPALREERRAELKEKIKARGIDSPSKETAFAAKAMGFNEKALPSLFTTDFMKNYTDAYEESRDENTALEVAKSNMSRVYGERDGEVVWMPPSKVWGVSEEYADHILIKQAEGLFADYKREFDAKNPNVDKHYQLADVSIDTSVAGELGALGERTGEKPKPVKSLRAFQIDSDGHKVGGQIMVIADTQTILPLPGKPPSHAIYFWPDGKELPVPIKNPNKSWEYARFSIDRKDLDSEQARKDQADFEAKKLMFEMRKNLKRTSITDLTEKTFSLS